MLCKYQIVVAVNNDKILADNLARSTAFSSVGVKILRGCHSASIAFNEVLDSSICRYLIFVHQDVYLPDSWLAKLDQLITKIEFSSSKDWAVLGVAGVNSAGKIVGRLWSEGIKREINEGHEIEEAVSLDEVILVINRQSWIRFDAQLPGFHLYGTDIVQNALRMGKCCLVVKNPIIHNDRTKYFLDSRYKKAYKYMSHKWQDVLPIPTTVAMLKKNYIGVSWRNFRQLKRYLSNGDDREIDSRLMAIQLGYEEESKSTR